jgi:hypothetical protein
LYTGDNRMTNFEDNYCGFFDDSFLSRCKLQDSRCKIHESCRLHFNFSVVLLTFCLNSIVYFPSIFHFSSFLPFFPFSFSHEFIPFQVSPTFCLPTQHSPSPPEHSFLISFTSENRLKQ